MKTIKFILVDDHPVVRDGMETMLLSEEGFESLGTAAGGTDALALCRAVRPDVVLSDVRMPDMDGFETLRAVRAEFPDMRFILLAGMPIAAERDQARQEGANGYISKSAELEELVAAIRRSVKDRAAFVEDVTEESPSVLTARELEVLRAMATGKNRDQAATELGIGPETVKTHLRTIMRKLNASNTVAAITTAIRLGLLR